MRADMGKADMPAAPTMGLTFSLVNILNSLANKNAACSVENEGNRTQAQDYQGLRLQKSADSAHGGADGDAQKQGHEVGQFILGSPIQALKDTRFFNQITEHQQTD